MSLAAAFSLGQDWRSARQAAENEIISVISGHALFYHAFQIHCKPLSVKNQILEIIAENLSKAGWSWT